MPDVRYGFRVTWGSGSYTSFTGVTNDQGYTDTHSLAGTGHSLGPTDRIGFVCARGSGDRIRQVTTLP
jgi:hypothetical protein